MEKCKVSGCEDGVLDEYDQDNLSGQHETKVVWCPVCQPHQYTEIIYQDDMLGLITDLAEAFNFEDNAGNLAATFLLFNCRAQQLLAKLDQE